MDGGLDSSPLKREEPPSPHLPVSSCSPSLLDSVRIFFTALPGLLSKLALGKEHEKSIQRYCCEGKRGK